MDIFEDVFAGEGQGVGILRRGRSHILFIIFMDQFDEDVGRFKYHLPFLGGVAVFGVEGLGGWVQAGFFMGIEVDANQFLHTCLFRFHFVYIA